MGLIRADNLKNTNKSPLQFTRINEISFVHCEAAKANLGYFVKTIDG